MAAALVRACDRSERLDILPLSDARAATLLARLDRERRMASARLCELDGTVLGGGAAVTGVCRHLPGLGWVAGVAARSARVARLLDRLYRAVADHRALLSRPLPDVAPTRRWRER